MLIADGGREEKLRLGWKQAYFIAFLPAQNMGTISPHPAGFSLRVLTLSSPLTPPAAMNWSTCRTCNYSSHGGGGPWVYPTLGRSGGIALSSAVPLDYHSFIPNSVLYNRLSSIGSTLLRRNMEARKETWVNYGFWNDESLVNSSLVL